MQSHTFWAFFLLAVRHATATVCSNNDKDYLVILPNGCAPIKTALLKARNNAGYVPTDPVSKKINNLRAKIEGICKDAALPELKKLRAVSDGIEALLRDADVIPVLQQEIRNAAAGPHFTVQEVLDCANEKICSNYVIDYKNVVSRRATSIRTELQEECDLFGCAPYKNQVTSAKQKILTASSDALLSPEEKLLAIANAITDLLSDEAVHSDLKSNIRKRVITGFGTFQQLLCAAEKLYTCNNNDKDYVDLFAEAGNSVRNALQEACNTYDNAKPCMTPVHKNKIQRAKSTIKTACEDANLSPLEKLKATADAVNEVLLEPRVEKRQKDLITQAPITNFGTIQDLLDCYAQEQ